MTAEPAREAVVEKLVEGGLGLARDDGKTLFVPYVAPGERIRYEAWREHSRRTEGRLIEVLSASEDRVDTPCPVYGACGGCQLQHLAAAAQLAAKRSIAIETLDRLGGIVFVDPPPIEPAPAPFGYRHRATVHIDWTRDPPAVGFHRFRSHETIDLSACPLLLPALNDALGRVRDALVPRAAGAQPPRAEIVAGDDGRVEVAFGVLPAPRGIERERLLAAAAEWPALRGLYWENEPGVFEILRASGEPLGYTVPDAGGAERRISFDVRAFTQANLAANRSLVEALLAATADVDGARLLDLYGGCGNFSVPLLPRLAAAHLVDSSAPALAHAEGNARAAAPLAPVDVSLGRCEAVLERLVDAGARFDVVLLDPPRSGATGALRSLARLAPPLIVYVSCNVPTLARDLRSLLREGYTLSSIRLFDLYPQTAHIEALAVLHRA